MSGLNGHWKFPDEVRGWLSEREGRKLADLAAGKRCLEIGAYAGRSTICMAQTADTLDVIDPLDGRATKGNDCDLTDELVGNLRRYGRGARIHAGTTLECAPVLPDGYFDFVFIDGDHSRAALAVDVQEALRLLRPGGVLAFHDYQSPADPDVTVAVNELLAGGAELVGTVDTLAVVKPKKAAHTKPVVALCMPRRGASCSFGASEGFHLAPTHGACEVVRMWTANSILDHTFNRLWSMSLNLRAKGVTHFAMIHDDICPPHGWLDVLLAELFRTRADVVSAVVPIKSHDGLTSTAIETADVWLPRRLTMHEVYDLPETFGDDEAGGELLLNSGRWVCDLRKPWVDEPEPLVFQTLNRIVRDDKGEWQAQVRSEDWEFSRAARARGAKLCATRKVTPGHDGEMEYPSSHPWGLHKTDPVYARRETEADDAMIRGMIDAAKPMLAEG